MANQKVKHIIAKLVGQSTESTLDVYDVDAVHTDKIANNLTTTSSGYVLDARQGKALNDSLVKRLGSANLTNSMRFAFAYITGAGKALNICVPTTILNTVSSINTTQLKIALRLPTGGYCIGDQADVTSKITQQLIGVGAISYVVMLDDAYTNNIPLVGAVWITCTFS